MDAGRPGQDAVVAAVHQGGCAGRWKASGVCSAAGAATRAWHGKSPTVDTPPPPSPTTTATTTTIGPAVCALSTPQAPRKKYRRPTMPNARARLNMVDPDDVGAQELQRAGNEAREARRPHRQGQRHGDREERRGKERRHSKPEVGGKGAARRARGGARGPSPKAGAARSSEPKASHSPTVAAKPRNAAAAAVARRRRRLLAKEISPTSASSAGAESGGSRSTGTDPSVGSPLGRRGAAHGRRRRPAANVAAEVEATPANSNGSASQSSSQAPRQQPRESARAVARRKAAKRAAEAGEFKFLPGRAALYVPPCPHRR